MELKNFFKNKFFSKICFFSATIILIIAIINPLNIFSNFPKNLIYLVICLYVISFLSLFINRNLDIYLTIISASFLTSIYLAEFYLAYTNFNYVQKYENILNKKENSGISFDNRSKYKIYNDLMKENPNIVIAVPPLSYLFSGNISRNISLFPLSGISNSQTIHCNESGFYSIYKSDRYGFNNPDNQWNKKKIDLILLGDSFTHGACVNRPNDIASNLRNNYNLNVLNLGYSANGPLIEYATLKEYFRVGFENIVWIFFEGNDISDFKFEKTNSILNNYLEDNNFEQDLKNKQSKIDILNKEIILNEKKFYFKKFIKLGNLRDLVKNSNNQIIDKKINHKSVINDNDVIDFIEIILKTREFCEKNNLNYYFVYLPDTKRILDNKYENNTYKQIKSKLKNNGVNFIDLKNTIYDDNDYILEYFPFGQIKYHFNEKGYARIAKEIYKFIYEK
tara:strand:- start:2091 stop:3440 length:1350 start_codon:yes stop_codon:yes gene_type:complete